MANNDDESTDNSTTSIVTPTPMPDSVSNVNVSKPMLGRRILSKKERELLEGKDPRGKEGKINFKNAVPPPVINNPLTQNQQPNQTQTPIASQKSDNNKVTTLEKKASEEFVLAKGVDSMLKKVQNLAGNLMGKKASEPAATGATPTPAPASSLGAAPSPTTPNPFAAAAAIPTLIKK